MHFVRVKTGGTPKKARFFQYDKCPALQEGGRAGGTTILSIRPTHLDRMEPPGLDLRWRIFSSCNIGSAGGAHITTYSMTTKKLDSIPIFIDFY